MAKYRNGESRLQLLGNREGKRQEMQTVEPGAEFEYEFDEAQEAALLENAHIARLSDPHAATSIQHPTDGPVSTEEN